MFNQKLAILCGLVLLFCASSFAGVTVDRDSVYVDVTTNYREYVGCQGSELDSAWVDCAEPSGAIATAKAKTYCHFKIINAAGDCLLWNGRVDNLQVGSATLTMAFPVNIVLTNNLFKFDTSTSDFTSMVKYSVSGSPTDVRLYADSSYVFQVTGQAAGCGDYIGDLGEEVLYSSSVTIPCCIGTIGNTNADVDDDFDISDLNYLVAFMFQNGPVLNCQDEGDFDKDGVLDVSDLVAIVDYFNGPPDPSLVDCP